MVIGENIAVGTKDCARTNTIGVSILTTAALNSSTIWFIEGAGLGVLVGVGRGVVVGLGVAVGRRVGVG